MLNNHLPPHHRFDFPAMNTLFSARLQCDDPAVASRMAGNCFLQLEELEVALSRFRPDSEVSRINHLKRSDSMLLSDATYRCFQYAIEAMNATAGLFDVTLGALTSNNEEARSSSAMGRLTIAPDRPLIVCEEEGRQVDFGGLGKGFALDEMARLLVDLDASAGLISAGASSHLAFGKEAWPFVLQGDNESLNIELSNRSLSASGIGIQGAHVVHPDTGCAPDYCFKRVWVVADSATLADAFSTACLLMNEQEITAFCASLNGGVKIYVEKKGTGRVQPVPSFVH